MSKYIKQAGEFRMSNIDPFEKYYRLTESRIDGLTDWITKMDTKLKNFVDNDPLRKDIADGMEYVRKIKQLHENIFSEFQKQQLEIEKLWQAIKQLKYQ